MKLSELKKELKAFYSECCGSGFESKSNGLWTYYVCNTCKGKTTPINGKGKMLGIWRTIEKYRKEKK